MCSIYGRGRDQFRDGLNSTPVDRGRGATGGGSDPEQVNIVCAALHQVDRPGFDARDMEAGEQLLSEFAATFGPSRGGPVVGCSLAGHGK